MSAKPLPFIRPGALDAGAEALRVEVREFIKHELSGYPPRLRAKNWTEHNATFSAKLGARGWIGLTWPKRYGGADRSHLERYVLIEELLAAGAPVGAHWIADRQSGPMLMRYSPEVWAPRICPGIARGEIFFCIGMSEPDAGSDLASVRSRARRVDGGWLLNGRKVWTSRAHQSHYMIALFRTGDAGQSRHGGLSQFLVDLKSPSITIRPIQNPLGEHEFNEVTFDDLLLPDECLLGEEGDGWAQVTAELSFERSGPERYLSSTQLLLEMLDLADAGSERDAIALGRVTAQFATLRSMSLGVSGMLARGDDPSLAATIVKDVGTGFEQALPAIAHDLLEGRDGLGTAFEEVLRHTTLAAPSFSLRGGTREILRGIIARGLGLR